LARLREALAQCEVAGPKSNIAFLERLVRHPAVVEARIDTGYLDRHLDEFLPDPDAPIAPALLVAAATARMLLQEQAAARRAAARPPAIRDRRGRWRTAGGWGMRASACSASCIAAGVWTSWPTATAATTASSR